MFIDERKYFFSDICIIYLFYKCVVICVKSKYFYIYICVIGGCLVCIGFIIKERFNGGILFIFFLFSNVIKVFFFFVS